MNSYQFVEYLKYCKKAKGRHGTHSPFVYSFIEEGINKNRKLPLLERITGYFTDWKIIKMPQGSQRWLMYLKAQAGIYNTRTLLIAPNIYESEDTAAVWDALCRQPEVQYSIDLFRYGLLFINPDFKEKQHFILKY